MSETNGRSSTDPHAGEGLPAIRSALAPSEARPLGPSEDMALVGRLLSCDESAFQGLIEQYHARLLRLALAFVADRSVAEEVVQDTWVAVLNGLPGFEGRSTLKTWIFRILTNRAKTRGTREARSVSFSSLMDDAAGEEPAVEPARFTADGMWADPPLPWKKETPEDLLLRGEALAVVQRALAELPPGQRAVVTLRDIEGLSSQETCNALEISETNQRVLLHRGRAKLRRALERYQGRS